MSGRFRFHAYTPLTVLLLVAIAISARPAGAQPDPSQMSGLPLPSGELPAGTVSVRVIRGQLSSNLPDQPVELVVDGRSMTVNTDQNGRAQFAGLTVGARVRAMTVVDDKRIESQEFTVPSQGGVRLMLVASAAGEVPSGAAPVPAQPGTVTLGGQSRIVVELDEEALRVYYLMDIVNATSAPVTTSTPLAFELPSGAQGAAMLQGSTPQGTAEGSRLVVRGPFQPGTTSFQAAYMLPYSGALVSIQQAVPVRLEAVTAIVENPGTTRVSSPQITQQREMTTEGRRFVVGSGPAVEAHGTLTLTLDGLPHAAAWPRQIALGLVVLIIAVGTWTASTPPEQGRSIERRQLEQKRERLFDDLVRVEEQLETGRIDRGTYDRRRRSILPQLEQVYARLDGDMTPAVMIPPVRAIRGAPQRTGAAR